MVEKFGMDARYPLPSASAKFFMGAYFFVIVAGWFVGFAPHRWFPLAPLNYTSLRLQRWRLRPPSFDIGLCPRRDNLWCSIWRGRVLA